MMVLATWSESSKGLQINWSFLGFTKPLSTALEGSDMDVLNGYTSATTLTNELKEIQCNKENKFARIFRDVNAMAAEMGKEIKVPRIWGILWNNYLVMNSVRNCIPISLSYWGFYSWFSQLVPVWNVLILP